jgi:hypothetical protein
MTPIKKFNIGRKNKNKHISRITVFFIISINAMGVNASQRGDVLELPPSCQDESLCTNVWEGKFKYGAFSSLIAAHIMRMEFPHLLVKLNRPITGYDEIKRDVNTFIKRYNDLPEWKIREIMFFALGDRTNSIFNEERSVIKNERQNKEFIKRMKSNMGLMPVDDLIIKDEFISKDFQFNTHRALYNNAYGIPQNSLAAILCAYVVGIRSIEFDVLETNEDNNYHISTVIHDLSTNRLSGEFNLPPIYVGKKTYSQIESTYIDILNPLAESQSVQRTGVLRLLRTVDVLEFAKNITPSVTLYIDARNNSPVSVIELLEGYPIFRDLFVLKVYPFTLNGGPYSVVAEFAKRKSISKEDAIKRLKKINPHLLLALGSTAAQASELSFVGGYSDFRWPVFQDERKHLPFSREAEVSKNEFLGNKIFNNDELRTIESMTYRLFKWSMEFPSIGNVLVFQVTLVPSLRELVDTQSKESSREEFNLMPQDEKINTAAIDNFIALYKRVVDGGLNVNVELGSGQSAYLRDEISKTAFGFSDRYPDYTLANFDKEGNIDQKSIRNFSYSMEGTVYTNDTYAMKKMRSTLAAMTKYDEMKADGLPIQYATTDIPTDFRAAMMGMNYIPSDIQYREGAIIKSRFTPTDIANYSPPDWTSRMYGDAYKISPNTFDDDLLSILELIKEINNLYGVLDSINISNEFRTIMLNPASLQRLNQTEPVVVSDLDQNFVHRVIDNLSSEVSKVRVDLDTQRIDFKNKYKVEAPDR